jgi:hypothetical protein
MLSILGIIVAGYSQTPPLISAVSDQRTFPNLRTRALTFAVSDSQTPADQLVVTGTSANPTLVPGTNIVFGGSGSNRTVTIIPVGVKGTNSITVTVRNTNGLTANMIFQVTIADFTDIGAALTPVDAASVAWGDYDNDGFLDLLVTGSQTARIYRNNHDGAFTNVSVALQGVSSGGAVWGDYNNDGRLDVLLTGTYNANANGYNVAQRIYRNDGANSFTQVGAFENPNGTGGTPPGRIFSLAWGDYDNDGKLDAVIMGWPFSAFLHNNGADSFGAGSLGLAGIWDTAVAWADYNNDGNLDFVLAQGGKVSPSPMMLYRNDGSSGFATPSNALPALLQGALAWEDFNNDGKLDLAMVGSTNGIYAGDGQGNFTNLPVSVPGGNLAWVVWGDMDNDGLPDLVVTSYSATQILRNNGDGTFTDLGISLPGAGNGGVAVGDFDNDGSLDIAVAGGGIAKIFHNDGAMPNAPPTPPGGLNSTVTASAMALNWAAATHSNQTGGLSYNVRVGITPGGMDVVSPMADPVNGFRRLPALGNAGLRLSRWLTNLKPGTYYWSVQAIDHTFAGSAFAPDQSFTLVAPSITSQPASQTNASPVASFYVSADGTAPLAYQWYLNGARVLDNARISGSTTTNLVIANVQASDFGNYTAIAANLVGAATSAVATATILSPVISNQPQGRVTWLGSSVALSVAASGQGSFTYQWRFNGADLPGETNAALIFASLQANQFGGYDVILANTYGTAMSSVATLTFSQVAAWGSNSHGETSLTNGLANLMAVSAAMNDNSDCQALKSDGTLVSWPGTSGAGVSNLIALAPTTHLGLRPDGTVLQWGSGAPATISGLSNIVAVAANRYGTLALRSNGNVVGSASIAGLTNAVAIAEGSQHSLALRSDGTVQAWGNNAYGQITVPLGLSNVIAIAAGSYHSLVLKGDGSLLAWGRNLENQTNIPPGLSNVVAIAAGSYHNLALRADGTVVAWGLNSSGQTTIPAGVTNVVAIAAGPDHSLALLGNSPPRLHALFTASTSAAGRFTVTLPTLSGRVYALQYESSPTGTNWTSLPLRAGNGATLLLTDPAATDPQRLYRALRW